MPSLMLWVISLLWLQAASLAVQQHVGNATYFDTFHFLLPYGVTAIPMAAWPSNGVTWNQNVSFHGMGQ